MCPVSWGQYIAVKQSSKFTDAEFGTLLDWSNYYSDLLISSSNILVRHIGEDFKKDILSVKTERERLWQEQKRREEQAKREEYGTNAAHEQRKHKRDSGQAAESKIDYYQILQVDLHAESEVISAAYRRLAAKYHPDVYKAPDATQRMQLLNEAYTVLSDPIKRQSYNETRHGL